MPNGASVSNSESLTMRGGASATQMERFDAKLVATYVNFPGPNDLSSIGIDRAESWLSLRHLVPAIGSVSEEPNIDFRTVHYCRHRQTTRLVYGPTSRDLADVMTAQGEPEPLLIGRVAAPGRGRPFSRRSIRLMEVWPGATPLPR